MQKVLRSCFAEGFDKRFAEGSLWCILKGSQKGSQKGFQKGSLAVEFGVCLIFVAVAMFFAMKNGKLTASRYRSSLLPSQQEKIHAHFFV